MASRFPLIVDAANVSNSIIKELPGGDYLDMTGSGIANVAVANLQVLGGSSGQVLSTNGSGNLSWITANSGGSNSYVSSEVRFTQAITTSDSTWIFTNPTTNGSMTTNPVDYQSNTYPTIAPFLATYTIANSVNDTTVTASSMLYGNGVYIKIPVDSGSNAVPKVSSDGVTWTNGGTLPYRSGSNSTTNMKNSWPLAIVGTRWFYSNPATAGAANTIATSTDNGTTWSAVTMPTSQTSGWKVIGHGTRIIAVSTESYTPTLYAAAEWRLRFVYSDDNGATWSTPQYTPSLGVSNFIYWTFVSSYPNSVIIGIQQGSRDYVISDDGGTTWTYVANGLVRTAGVGVGWNGTYWLVDGNGSGFQMSYDGKFWISAGYPAGFPAAIVYEIHWNGAFWIVPQSAATAGWYYFKHPWNTCYTPAGAARVISASNTTSLFVPVASDGVGNTFVGGDGVLTGSIYGSRKYTMTLPSTFRVVSPLNISSGGAYYIKT